MGNTNQGVEYKLGEETIPHDSEEKDLGVIISEDTKSSRQCAAAANKAMSKLRVIKRTFKYFDKKSFTTLYKTYVRPHLEYSVQAWCPYLKRDITELEKVQRRATKLVPGLRHLSYPERLQQMDLYTVLSKEDFVET